MLHVRGVPFWGAILLALVLGIAGILVSRAFGAGLTGWPFSVLVVLGIAVAALAVRRGAIFTAMVQAPIIVTLLVFVSHYAIEGSGSSNKSAIVNSGIAVVSHFPTMAIATAVGLLLGLVRIIAQPVRRHPAPRPPAEPYYHEAAQI